jgi:hypothetical protein
MSLLLAIKATLSPALVTLASLGARRHGPRFAGWLAGFPIVAGPVLLFFSLEQGPAFASAAAGSTLLGLVSLSAFCLVYGVCAATLAKPHGWWVAMPAGWLAFLGLTAAQVSFQPGTPISFGLALVALQGAARLLPRPPGEAGRVVPGPWDIPSRAIATASLVLSLTGLAHLLGPKVSGLLTPFPVASTILVVFAHKEGGPVAVVGLLRGLLAGLQTFAAFCLVLAYALPVWGVAWSFLAALSVSITLQFMVLRRGR